MRIFCVGGGGDIPKVVIQAHEDNLVCGTGPRLTGPENL